MRIRSFAALAILVLLNTPATSVHAGGLEYTVLINDRTGDGVGFYDVIEVAIAEPGDDTVIWRVLTADSTSDAFFYGSVDLFFEAPAGDFRASIEPGAIGDDFSLCDLVDGYIYCTMTYETLGGGVGSTIVEPYAISYLGTAMDFAPGATVGPTDILLAERGDSYTLTGCTVQGGC